MPLSLLSSRSSANRLAYAALALSFSLLASVAPTPVGAQGLPDFTELVEKVGPAVVNIRTTERGRTARGGSGNEQEDEMAELFRRFFGVPGQPNRPNPRGGPPQPDGEPQQRG
ncbi:MAG: serine peptidase, partial [Pseudomonadota bacterium]|nr:serine peptidase [Pseudomonadota bacterium]